MKALIELHSYKALQETLNQPTIAGLGLSGLGLQGYQTKMIQGAIDIQNFKVKDIMIPFSRVFSISITKKIDQRGAKKILKHGFSRIPVYVNKDKHSMIGYLLIKTLVGVDLSEGLTIKELMTEQIVTLRKPLFAEPTEPLGGLLSRFKNGKSHMAIVTDNVKQMQFNMQMCFDEDESFFETVEEDKNTPHEQKPKVLGIITLEDIIEIAFKEDILDEADYDLENEANVKIKLDKSIDAASEPTDPRERLHEILTEKIKDTLASQMYKKKSELFGPSNTATPRVYELNDLKTNLLNKEHGSDKGLLDKIGTKGFDSTTKLMNPENKSNHHLESGFKKI